jgi:hypothetical protein
MDLTSGRNQHDRHSEKTASGEFRSEALRNKYGAPVAYCITPDIICFSETMKFLAVFSVALTFSFVLSLVSRQEKEHCTVHNGTRCAITVRERSSDLTIHHLFVSFRLKQGTVG